MHRRTKRGLLRALVLVGLWLFGTAGVSVGCQFDQDGLPYPSSPDGGFDGPDGPPQPNDARPRPDGAPTPAPDAAPHTADAEPTSVDATPADTGDTGPQDCDRGNCECAPALTMCDSACVDLQTNPDHCGRCNDKCDGDELCRGGDCTDD